MAVKAATIRAHNQADFQIGTRVESFGLRSTGICATAEWFPKFEDLAIRGYAKFGANRSQSRPHCIRNVF